jgi:hypothetical protein
MFYRTFIIGILVLGWVLSHEAGAVCAIQGDHEQNHDLLKRVLMRPQACPKNVFELRDQLLQLGAKINTALVANRGLHNLRSPSFSLFEMVTGTLDLSGESLSVNKEEFVFGHFTNARRQPGSDRPLLFADQNPGSSLMGEFIVWDPRKGYYNFYDLKGNGNQGNWVYQGDTKDILTSLHPLHLRPDSQIGHTPRCVACHRGGGLILKELAAPHNDWWEPTRGAIMFASWDLDPLLARITKGTAQEALVPGSMLAEAVTASQQKLQESPGFQKVKASLSLQERLRPLFCPVELNIESDSQANQLKKAIVIPSGFFVDTRLATQSIVISREHYEAALTTIGSTFRPEYDANDADHPWLTPVKAHSDVVAIKSLLVEGLPDIDEELVADVLAIDMTRPVYSPQRCELLQAVPERFTPAWKMAFIQNLKKRTPETAVAELVKNLETPANASVHQESAQKLLHHCALKLQQSEHVVNMVRLLAQRRIEVRPAEERNNPVGQVMEQPTGSQGFRLVFPEVPISLLPGKLHLDPECNFSS